MSHIFSVDCKQLLLLPGDSNRLVSRTPRSSPTALKARNFFQRLRMLVSSSLILVLAELIFEIGTISFIRHL